MHECRVFVAVARAKEAESVDKIKIQIKVSYVVMHENH